MAPAKFQPALLGGITIGVLSALPVINFANCCCAWILFGGMLSAYLMQQNHPEPIQIGDGAIVGLLAGIIGAFVWLLVDVPIRIAMAPFMSDMSSRIIRDLGDMAPEMRAVFENMAGAPAIGLSLVLGFFVMLCASSVFGMLGGLFGALMFKKNQAPVIPPPIPQ
ncbi:MAG TPA: hypothetical protein VJ691_13690 [Vicinamibacterales bacterium]|nr:hypothetical protein [Vicinamibacterales bacterium]